MESGIGSPCLDCRYGQPVNYFSVLKVGDILDRCSEPLILIAHEISMIDTRERDRTLIASEKRLQNRTHGNT